MYGLGASLAYTPSLAILGHYFKRYLGLVNGIVTAGSSIFTTLMPYLIEVILRRFGLEGTLRFLAMLTAIVMPCAILFKPIPRKFHLCIRTQLKFRINRNFYSSELYFWNLYFRYITITSHYTQKITNKIFVLIQLFQLTRCQRINY